MVCLCECVWVAASSVIPAATAAQCLGKQRGDRFDVTAHIRQCPGIRFRSMSAVSHAGGVRRGAAPDPHIVELSKLMLARAPELGEAMADRLFREIDAYRDGTVVTKDEVRPKLRGKPDVHLRLARRGRGRRRLARRAHRHRTRARRCAAAGGDDGLPDRFPIHVGGDPRRRAGRGDTHRIDPGRHRTRLPRPGHLHPGDGQRLPPAADRADPRAGGRTVGVGRSAAVAADHRQPKPLGGSRSAAAAHHRALRRRGGRAAGDRKTGLAHDRKQALRPRHPVGVAAAAGLAGRHRPCADTRHSSTL